MIKTIAHFADIHIEKSTARHEEYRIGFNRVIQKLEKQKPCRVIIVGDLFDDNLETSNEMYIIAGNFLREISSLTKKLIITTGNHDININNTTRVNSIQAVIENLNINNIFYLNKSGFYIDENVIWVVHDFVDKQNPWVEIMKNHVDKSFLFKNLDMSDYKNEIKKDNLKEFFKKYKKINLYHNPINGCIYPNQTEANSDKYRSLNDFYGDMLLMGDIHKKQYFNKKKYE